MIKGIIPKSVRKFILRKTRFPGVGKIKSLDLISTDPISRSWGGDRGFIIDRYYVEKFLQQNSQNIRGRVLEIGDNYYTKKFGGKNVEKSEILHASNDNPDAAYIGDLADIPIIGDNKFDCIICTQTLQLIPNLDAAINTLHRILKPNGVLLVTIPGISQIYIDENGLWPDFWRFTKNSAKYIFNKKFNSKLEINSYGNVLTSIAFLHGLSVEDLSPDVLEIEDEYYQMLICVKAVK